MDKPLITLRTERTQITRIKSKRDNNITTNFTEMKRIKNSNILMNKSINKSSNSDMCDNLTDL